MKPASSALRLVHAALPDTSAHLPEVAIRLDRQKLAKRLWRAKAEDGTDFGFEGNDPARDGDLLAQVQGFRYVVRQLAEPVLEIPLDVAADDAAVIGWAVGNLHFPIEGQPGRLLAPDDPGLRQALDRLGVPYHAVEEVFRPRRFAGHPSGHGHGHGDGASAHVH